MLMDEETLKTFRALWGVEPDEQRHLGNLEHLTPEEQALYDALRGDVLGTNVRLEQERVGFGYLLEYLRGNALHR